MGSGAIQIAIILFAILGAAALALFCDYLRHRNEELRTALAATPAPTTDDEPVPEPEPVPAAEIPPVETHSWRPRRRRHAATSEEVASEVVTSQPEEIVPTPCHDLLPIRLFEAKPAEARVPHSDVVPIPQQTNTGGALKDWLSRRAGARMPVQAIALPVEPAVIEEPKEEPKLVLVARAETAFVSVVQDADALTRLLANWQPYTGLVICVALKNITERVIEKTVAALLTDMAQPGEMLFRSAKDEFVLLSPHEKSGDSRRRLSAISHQLWDYQLRNLSNFSMLFGWGSEEAWRVPLSDALQAARENMALTNRTTRKVG